MKYNTLNYSLKVWLTALLLSPLLYLLILLLRTLQNHPDDQLSILLFMYVIFLANSFLYSLLSFLTFWTLTGWIGKTTALPTQSKFIVTISIAVLFPVLYLIINPYERQVSSANNLWLMISYVIITISSSLYYEKPLFA